MLRRPARASLPCSEADFQLILPLVRVDQPGVGVTGGPAVADGPERRQTAACRDEHIGHDDRRLVNQDAVQRPQDRGTPWMRRSMIGPLAKYDVMNTPGREPA